MRPVCGVDIGSRSIEVVVFDGQRVIEARVAETGPRPRQTAQDVMMHALRSAGVLRDEVGGIAATGYGRNYFEGADWALSEIICHAMGVWHLFPSARTVLDIGGQDSKFIKIGENGRVLNFAMNDRCAAGTGKFLEMAAQTMQIKLAEMGAMTVGVSIAQDISSMCAVFAESEIIGHLQSGTPPEHILNGVFRSIARRTLSMTGLAKLDPHVVFTGGVALNEGVVRAIEQESGCSLLIPYDPRITGALGAAIIASRKANEKRVNEPVSTLKQ